MNVLINQAKQIRLVIFDVDGVLTPGSLFYGPEGPTLKSFHVHDGQGIKLLQKAGIEVGIITVCTSSAIAHRMRDLGIAHVYQGQTSKLAAYEILKQKLNLTDQQIAYMGDDLPDLGPLSRAGLAVTVPSASKIIQEQVHWTTQAKGGKGAARELCDFILQAQGIYQKLVESFKGDIPCSL